MAKILPVIMSGGAGSRLWPASRQAAPKQLLALVSERTMVQETATRLKGDIFLPPAFMCNARHADQIEHQISDTGVEIGAVIVEPVGRNTAACGVAAALHALDMTAQNTYTGDEPPLVLLLAADHHVTRPEAFQSAIEAAIPAAQSGHLVTFGIRPDGPETGYGYIERGAALDDRVFHVSAFREKPDAETAQRYIATGNYDWNAGIFLFAPSTLLSEMTAHAPDVVNTITEAHGQAQHQAGRVLLNSEAFARCPSIAFDYAVMEPTDKAAVVPVDMGWSDIGSFTALHTVRANLSPDASGMVTTGDVLTHEAANCLAQTDGPLVALVGVEDLAVIVHDGAVLVTRLDRSQNVKDIVNQLKAGNRTDKL